jgi:hypothetical protein
MPSSQMKLATTDFECEEHGSGKSNIGWVGEAILRVQINAVRNHHWTQRFSSALECEGIHSSQPQNYRGKRTDSELPHLYEFSAGKER